MTAYYRGGYWNGPGSRSSGVLRYVLGDHYRVSYIDKENQRDGSSCTFNFKGTVSPIDLAFVDMYGKFYRPK
jgi:hypothetical protein